MANYNYVAPLNYKSFSDMNKERLAAKAALDAQRAKQRSAVDKRRQDFLSKISGYNTTGWAKAHVVEYDEMVLKAKSEAFSNPTPDYIGMADAIMRMQDLGDNHAELRSGQTEYESYMGPNALQYDGDLPWGMTAIHNAEGYEERLKKFNNVGLINYNETTKMGDFPNPDYDPSAPAGQPNSYQTIREMAEANKIPIFNKNGKDYVMIGEETKQVSGNAYDVAPEGFGGLWNPTLTAINNFTAEAAFFDFENRSGKKKFKAHATELNKRVVSDEITFEEAQTRLREDILSYLNPESPQADRALIASAITAYELPEEQGGTGQDWEDVQGNQSLEGTYGTPWDRFADQIVDVADLYDPDDASSGGSLTQDERNRAATGSREIKRPDMEFIREMGNEQYNWEEALRYTEADLSDIFEEVPVLENGRPKTNDVTGGILTTKKLKPGAFDIGARIEMPQTYIKFDGAFIDNIEVFPVENLIMIYSTSARKAGDAGPYGDIGEPGDQWRYSTTYGGKPGVAGWIFINYEDEDGQPSDQYRTLRRNFSSEGLNLDKLIKDALPPELQQQ
jgi:hypothetical protein